MAEIRNLYSGAAITASGNGNGVSVPLGQTVGVQLVVSAASGTTPSATFEVQWSIDGVNWCSADGTKDTFAAVTAAGNACKNLSVKGTWMRLAYTVSGTTPSFTVAASACGVVGSNSN